MELTKDILSNLKRDGFSPVCKECGNALQVGDKIDNYYPHITPIIFAENVKLIMLEREEKFSGKPRLKKPLLPTILKSEWQDCWSKVNA